MVKDLYLQIQLTIKRRKNERTFQKHLYHRMPLCGCRICPMAAMARTKPRWHPASILCTDGLAKATQKTLACGVGEWRRFTHSQRRTDLHAHTAGQKRSRYSTRPRDGSDALAEFLWTGAIHVALAWCGITWSRSIFYTSGARRDCPHFGGHTSPLRF